MGEMGIQGKTVFGQLHEMNAGRRHQIRHDTELHNFGMINASLAASDGYAVLRVGWLHSL